MAELDANSSNGSTDSSNDSLNGSWVKLEDSTSFKNGSEHPVSIHNGKMEDLLAEAVVDEGRITSGLRSTTRESLLHSSPSEVEATELNPDSNVLPPEFSPKDQSWVEDWSSRVEPHPPKKWKITYPSRGEPTCTEAAKSKANIIQVNFYIVVPTLLLTHVIAFGIGFYLGRRSSTGPTSV